MKKILTVLLLSSLSFFAYPDEVLVDNQNYSIYLPVSWYPLDVKPEKVVVSNQDNSAYFISRMYNDKTYASLDEFCDSILSEIDAEAETDEFVYHKGRALFSKISFVKDSFDFKGYAFFTVQQDSYLALLAFSDADKIDQLMPYLLSVIDTYAPDDASFLMPGPISQYLTKTADDKPETARLSINGRDIHALFSSAAADTTQWVIEREMSIMSAYQPDETGMEAWKRCYRLIYRDAFRQTEKLYTQIRSKVIRDNGDKTGTAEILLKWLQEFDYDRTDDLADFLNPVDCVIYHKGDCDSLVMLYVMLLKRFDIDAVLFVSTQYSHAMAGIALDPIDTKGAFMINDEVRYYVAELTADVDIGLIDSAMSDMNAWQTITFR